VVVLLAVTGCGQGDSAGLRISERGMYLHTAANYTIDTEKTIVEHFAKELGPHWTMAITITPLPTLIDARNDLDREFRWREVTAAVSLSGTGLQSEVPVPEARMRGEIEEFLRKLQTPPGGAVTVTITRSIAAIDHPLATTPQPPVPHAGAAARSYVIQAGDTLAEISSVFYGSPIHWRTLVAANPGLDPANLTPGQALTIPPKP
jgi:LysM repeat protein